MLRKVAADHRMLGQSPIRDLSPHRRSTRLSLPVFRSEMRRSSPMRAAAGAEFYRDAEYGEYLNRFADAFKLHPHIRPRSPRRAPGSDPESADGDSERAGWLVTFRDESFERKRRQRRDHRTFRRRGDLHGTGGPNQRDRIGDPGAFPERVECAVRGSQNIRNERIVVFGGGESAVDFATRLSQPELGNEVLSFAANGRARQSSLSPDSRRAFGLSPQPLDAFDSSRAAELDRPTIRRSTHPASGTIREVVSFERAGGGRARSSVSQRRKRERDKTAQRSGPTS